MADYRELLREDIITITRLCQETDYEDAVQVRRVRKQMIEKQVFQTDFGNRYIERISLIADGKEFVHSCILCKRDARAYPVICSECMEKIPTQTKEKPEEPIIEEIPKSEPEEAFIEEIFIEDPMIEEVPEPESEPEEVFIEDLVIEEVPEPELVPESEEEFSEALVIEEELEPESEEAFSEDLVIEEEPESEEEFSEALVIEEEPEPESEEAFSEDLVIEEEPEPESEEAFSEDLVIEEMPEPEPEEVYFPEQQESEKKEPLPEAAGGVSEAAVSRVETADALPSEESVKAVLSEAEELIQSIHAAANKLAVMRAQQMSVQKEEPLPKAESSQNADEIGRQETEPPQNADEIGRQETESSQNADEIGRQETESSQNADEIGRQETESSQNADEIEGQEIKSQEQLTDVDAREEVQKAQAAADGKAAGTNEAKKAGAVRGRRKNVLMIGGVLCVMLLSFSLGKYSDRAVFMAKAPVKNAEEAFTLVEQYYSQENFNITFHENAECPAAVFKNGVGKEVMMENWMDEEKAAIYAFGVVKKDISQAGQVWVRVEDGSILQIGLEEEERIYVIR